MNNQPQLFLVAVGAWHGQGRRVWEEERLVGSASQLEPGLRLQRRQVARRLVLGVLGGRLSGLEDDRVWADGPLGLA